MKDLSYMEALIKEMDNNPSRFKLDSSWMRYGEYEICIGDGWCINWINKPYNMFFGLREQYKFEKALKRLKKQQMKLSIINRK